ncbi:Programmed cell death toxin YdcE [Acidisarcina polymorpha]|uniref:mRNA interferase n=1 Tax=Acidisarcina polymorpha TaxID=2211140 RepID=A0A2Z5FXG0_9BACT|nr:type II toxin-antitoxin system PemK/MazF family toxin [Acidisarcina polymorpha]AXC11472.1 Programmed cell death toxin YdcE [Acidisarcina polymorpha]
MTVGKPFRGVVVEVGFDPVVGHEQGKSRPCIVVQNDIGNRFSSTTIVVPLTDASHIKKPFPVYVLIRKGDGGLKKDSYALCDQVRVVDQQRFRGVYGTLAPANMSAVDQALRVSLGL